MSRTWCSQSYDLFPLSHSISIEIIYILTRYCLAVRAYVRLCFTTDIIYQHVVGDSTRFWDQRFFCWWFWYYFISELCGGPICRLSICKNPFFCVLCGFRFLQTVPDRLIFARGSTTTVGHHAVLRSRVCISSNNTTKNSYDPGSRSSENWLLYSSTKGASNFPYRFTNPIWVSGWVSRNLYA